MTDVPYYKDVKLTVKAIRKIANQETDSNNKRILLEAAEAMLITHPIEGDTQKKREEFIHKKAIEIYELQEKLDRALELVYRPEYMERFVDEFKRSLYWIRAASGQAKFFSIVNVEQEQKEEFEKMGITVCNA